MRGKRRSPEERVSNVAGPLPPCRVCGQEGAGFHYGVNTCEACKGFFRRSLLRHNEYVCIKSENCNVIVNRRKSCPKCRYMKCLYVGMSKEAIKTGRYTYTKRTSDIHEVQQLVLEGKIPAEKLEKPNAESLKPSSTRTTFTSSQKLSPDISLDYSICTSIDDIGQIPLSMDPLVSKQSSDVSYRISDAISQSDGNDLDIKAVPSGGSLRMKLRKGKLINSWVSTHQSERQTKTDKQVMCYSDGLCLQSTLPVSMNAPGAMSPQVMTPLSPSSLETVFTELMPLSPLMRLLEINKVGSDCLPNGEFLSTSTSSGGIPLSPISMASSEDYLLASLSPAHLHEYTEQDLDETIDFVTSVHKIYARDFIDEPEEILQERFEKCFHDCKLKEKVFGEMKTIERKDYEDVLKETGIDVDGRLFQLTECISNIEDEVKYLVALCKALPEFRRLNLLSQEALLKGSSLVLLFIGYYKGYDSQKKMLLCRHKSFCTHDLAMWGEEHMKLMDMLFGVADKLKSCSMSYAMHVCLKMITLFNPDYVMSDDKEAVEQLNDKYHECLKLLFSRAHPSKGVQQLNKEIKDLVWMLRYMSSSHGQLVRELDILSYKPVSENKIYMELLDF